MDDNAHCPGPEDLDVPEEPPDPEQHEHVLSEADLQYPELEFEEGSLGSDGRLDAHTSVDREELRSFLDRLAGGVTSHDIAVRTPDGYVVFGVGAESIDLAYEPGEPGEIELTMTMPAAPVAASDDPDVEVAGNRGGSGFIPLAMLTEDEDPGSYRCYNWIDDPLADLGAENDSSDLSVDEE